MKENFKEIASTFDVHKDIIKAYQENKITKKSFKYTLEDLDILKGIFNETKGLKKDFNVYLEEIEEYAIENCKFPIEAALYIKKIIDNGGRYSN